MTDEEKYRFSPYSNDDPVYFEGERARLTTILGPTRLLNTSDHLPLRVSVANGLLTLRSVLRLRALPQRNIQSSPRGTSIDRRQAPNAACSSEPDVHATIWSGGYTFTSWETIHKN